MAGTTATLLTRENLTSVRNLFVLNPGNNSFLLGASQRRSGAPTLISPLFFLILGAIFAGCPLAAAASTPDGQNTLLGLAVIIGIPCLLGAALTYRAYRRARRLETGQMLQATITGVSVRERSEVASTGLNLLAIALLILDLISIFDSSSRTTTASGGYSPGDFYELSLQFTAATPSGTQIGGTARQNRPDMRGSLLPRAGDPLVILYVDDTLYKVM